MDGDSKAGEDRIRLGRLLPLLPFLSVPYQVLYYPRVSEVEWYSVISEGFVAVLFVVALILVDKLRSQRRVYWPLLAGFMALLFSTVTDVLDEFLQQPEMVTILLEDMLQLVGTMAVVIGIYQWSGINRQLQGRLQQQAHTDYLTGVLNRRGFMARFEQEVRRGSRYGTALTLIWFDLDRFKEVNDRYGHHTGDEVLRNTAAKAARIIRGVDIFARMGGEEFCVLMPETPLDGAADVAEKLRGAIASCDCAGDASISASFGVGEYRAGEEPDQFLGRVDRALYRAKQQGRNRVVVEDAPT